MPGISILMAAIMSSKAWRVATGSTRSIWGSRSMMAASSGSIMSALPPSSAIGLRREHEHRVTMTSRASYLGCIRIPASMRIDSALMYELDSSSSARVANSVE